jgi:outer membrane receptor protein involved in Fe transport
LNWLVDFDELPVGKQGSSTMSKTRLLVSCAATALFVSGAPAFAQTQTTADSDPQTQPCTENTPGCEALDSAATGSQSADEQVTTGTTAGSVTETGAIVVTGSRIRKPNLSSPVPVTSLTAAELPTQGQANIGDALNDLPSLRSTYSSQNSGRFIGTAGLNFLDLRGLGPSRTLVLVNGRRHVTASAGDFIVDVQTIPADLIERIDIVTGGESAVYGSDAIAGVVNFVLKRDFEGIRASGQAGVSDKGDRGVYSGSITAGQNFSGGRGNVAVNFEYVHSEPLYYRQREHWRNLGGFLPVDDTVGESAEGDGKPDNAFFEGPVRLGGITLGGSLGFLSLDGTQLAFAPNGNLVFATPDKAFLEFGSGSVISDNPLTGATLQETGQLAVGSDRYAANLLAHYDFSDAFRPFIEAKYVHLKVLQEGQPSFFQGYLSDFFGSIVPDLRCNNPFLNAQALGALQSVGLCANPDTGTFPLSRFNVDFGARSEISKRDT